MLSCCAKMNTALNSYLFLNLDILFANLKNIFIFNEGIQRKKKLIYFYCLISIVLRFWFSFLSTSTILQLRGPFRIEKICVLFFKLLKKGQKMFKPRIFLLSFQLKQAIAISRAINFQQVEAGLLRKG